MNPDPRPHRYPCLCLGRTESSSLGCPGSKGLPPRTDRRGYPGRSEMGRSATELVGPCVRRGPTRDRTPNRVVSSTSLLRTRKTYTQDRSGLVGVRTLLQTASFHLGGRRVRGHQSPTRPGSTLPTTPSGRFYVDRCSRVGGCL